MGAPMSEEFMYAPQAAEYLKTTTRKISLYRRSGILKSIRFGKHFLYKKTWCDEFAENWQGFDLSSEKAVALAIASKKWREAHAD